MNHTVRIATLLLVTSGCSLDKEIVGATLADPGTDAGDTATNDVSGTAEAGSETMDPTMEGPLLEYGDRCEFAVDGEPYAPTDWLVLPQPACAGGICLFGAEAFDASPCEVPADCAGVPEQSGECAEWGFCALDPEWVHSRSLCSQTCEAAEDCPADDSCASGFSCAPITKIGVLCCQKMCVCNDDYGQESMAEVAAYCAQETECGA